VKLRRAGLGRHQHDSGGCFPIFRAIVRGQHLDFRNGVHARVDDEGVATACRIDAIVQNIRPVDLENVVFDAPPIHAVLCAPGQTNFAFVLIVLAADTRRQRNQLRGNPPV